MPKQVLTDRQLKNLKPAPAGKRLDYMDAVVPGFGVRVTDKGQKTFVLIARYPGSKLNLRTGKADPTRRALGKVGNLTLEQARRKARRWHELIGRGVDPRNEEKRQRDAEAAERQMTFGVVIEDFLRHHVKGQRRAAITEREVRRELIPRWAEKPIAEFSPRDIAAMVDEIVDRGATRHAHNVYGHTRTFFNWCIGRGVYGLETSPCDRLKPSQLIGRKNERQRVLTDSELRALWKAAEAMGYPYGPLCRLLILTGQRKSEVAEAQWRECDFAQNVWRIPPERFKSNAIHLVPLPDQAAALVKSLPRWTSGDFLFSTNGGKAAVNGFSKAKAQLDRLMAAELGAMPDPWVIHDIRRTVRTRLSALRVPEPVAEIIIGHARKGLARVYDQHHYTDEMRDALAAWEAKLRSIVEPPPENTLELRARG